MRVVCVSYYNNYVSYECINIFIECGCIITLLKIFLLFDVWVCCVRIVVICVRVVLYYVCVFCASYKKLKCVLCVYCYIM